MRKDHHIYVIELDPQVWHDNKKFRRANPNYLGKRECLYVGMTSTTPNEKMFKRTIKTGVKISSRIAAKYGKFLRPSLYAPLNPMTKLRAIKMESYLAHSLRIRGYAVWWN